MVDCHNSPHLPTSSDSNNNVDLITSCSFAPISKEASHSLTHLSATTDLHQQYEASEQDAEDEIEEPEIGSKSLEISVTSESRLKLNEDDEKQSPSKEEESEFIDKSPIDAKAQAIEKRKQPLMELLYSEESYVRRLRIAYELYMPAAYRTPGESNLIIYTPTTVPSSPMPNNCNFEELAAKLPPGGPTVPDDLFARWRILWGNWLQLFEWHSGFLEKLKALLDEDPDRIPKLFIDSRARLRSIYSKYCENQIKAAHIAEQHKEFFDEWRIHVADKEDVLSLLMQPVQRIMRYQLPIGEIVKWTERAQLPSLALWQKALDIMKEIPKDTQLILEAARIDGFPGVITSLGTLRIRGDLLVASLSHIELSYAVSAYARALNVCSTDYEESNLMPNLMTSSTLSTVAATSPSLGVMETSITVSSDDIAHNRTASSLALPEDGSATDTLTQIPGQKFVVSRLFLFDKMLLVTEEMKAKRKGTAADAFAQSTYQFRAAINVNKMRFEPHWFMCTLAQDSDGKLSAFRSALDLAAPDDLRFVLWDQTPGRDVVYIIDPHSVAVRSAWVVHLRDIQRMQQQLLMALVDPTRFANATAEGDQNWGPSSSAPLTDICYYTAKPDKTKDTQQQHHAQPHRKWPSFTMRRPTRLSSSSSSNTNATAGGHCSGTSSLSHSVSTSRNGHKVNHTIDANHHQHQQQQQQTCSDTNLLLRSYSVEQQHRVNVGGDDASCRNVECTRATSAISPHVDHRKTSDGCILDNSAYVANATGNSEGTGEDGQRNTMGFQKTKKVLSSIFGKHKKVRQHSSNNINSQASPPVHPLSTQTVPISRLPPKQRSESTHRGHQHQQVGSVLLPPPCGHILTPDTSNHDEQDGHRSDL